MMAILAKSDDVRSGTKAQARHGRSDGRHRTQCVKGVLNNTEDPLQIAITGSEIALSWSPIRLKILHWRPEFHNWSPAGD